MPSSLLICAPSFSDDINLFGWSYSQWGTWWAAGDYRCGLVTLSHFGAKRKSICPCLKSSISTFLLWEGTHGKRVFESTVERVGPQGYSGLQGSWGVFWRNAQCQWVNGLIEDMQQKDWLLSLTVGWCSSLSECSKSSANYILYYQSIDRQSLVEYVSIRITTLHSATPISDFEQIAYLQLKPSD